MNLRLKPFVLMAGFFILAAMGCGRGDLNFDQGLGGAPKADDIREGGPADHAGSPEFEIVSYETLYATLTQTLGVIYDATDYDNGPMFEPVSAADDPLHNPILFLESRKDSLAAANLSDVDPDTNVAPGAISGLGIKNWALAVTGAAGISMAGTKRAEFFPEEAGGIGSYDTAFLVLLSRYPTSAEVEILDELVAEFQTEADKAAAVVSALLMTLEFLTLN